ncbi:hypothetical protein FRC14_002926 [Serendipita sp. 396]|nr:hypothetical protein FRC14_002926 [Serendipita sp. 396]KAG8784173.1 hypothetical protein FRC15_003892 [Serendipita sp. 397]KAG8828005.1 hypothetical protein FRC19_010513 [Serendipita sp. 401]KAG8833816.1 hypothetical protein FRC18_003029 [Serendipita sp. 400]KAG8861605.1 hypothetical protein FRB91_003728 [Serendipita sp. 411]KAG8867786.1 hypothetical protein FRC20_004882 [Serendipita sp. 405]KAG9058270.1 hypothetical protein FS842_011150 [Serendipita sp. 407]
MPIATVVNVDHADGIPAVDLLRETVPNPTKQITVLPASFYSYFLSTLSKGRIPSAIRGLLPYESRPNMLSLLAGKPNPSLFPITSFSLTVQSPIDPSSSTQLTIDGEILEEALQYGPTQGLPQAHKWFVGLQEVAHNRPANGGEWGLSVGNGSQDLIYKAFSALLNPGDHVLVEAPVYAGVVPLLTAQKAICIEIDTDESGVSTSKMREILDNWPATTPKPKVFYTVPYGCNPSGVTTTLERRLEVLKLAHDHNFIVMEDDPYYYLYFGQIPRPPSYFELEGQQSMETGTPVGRILRFDSFSKILSAGLRLGLVTGPKPLVDAINVHTASANLQPSSTSQAIAFALLNSWGYDTFFAHTRLVSEFYRKKREVFTLALDRHLQGLAEWTIPEAGMFFWIKLHLPPSNESAEGDSESLIRDKALEAGVLALPGKSFFVNSRKTPYVRTAFSLLDEKDVDEALRRLAAVIKEARGD